MSLTSQQEKFAQEVASGKSQSDAYRVAYPKNRKPERAWEQASRLMTNCKVTARIEFLRAELASKELWTREQSVMALVGVINTPDKNSDIVAAVKELNSMHGFNAPVKIDLNLETMTDAELAAQLVIVESKLVSR